VLVAAQSGHHPRAKYKLGTNHEDEHQLYGGHPSASNTAIGSR
jgi:hypothetical protein